MRQVILVSGGSRGLGQALVADFLARGFAVATFSRSATPFVEQCVAQYGSEGAFLWAAVDATEREAIKHFALSVVKKFGRIDALINNAGILVDGPLPLMRADDVHRVLALNLESVVYLTQACARAMLPQGSGSIVNVSSLNAVRGHRGVAVYSAAKAGLDGLTRSLARELGPRNIRVNSIAPGYFESEMTHGITPGQREQILRRTPLKRLGTPEDIVGAIRFLVSDDARFITGQTILVDGGITC